MACCGQGSGCQCRVQAQTDGGDSPVVLSVTGAGSQASPFIVGHTWTPSRAVRLDGNEPWTLDGDEIVPRVRYWEEPTLLMCNAGGVLVGYAYEVQGDAATTITLGFQALDTTTVTTTLPSGWRPCCGQAGAAAFHPFYTDGDTPSTLVGYGFVRYDNETGIRQQQYVTLAGSITSTIPVGWEQGSCASGDGGGNGGDTTIADPLPGSIHLYLQSGTVLSGRFYPDWGQPGLADADRWDALHLPYGYDGADWSRLVVTVTNVQTALTDDLTVTLRDLTNAVDVATYTWGSGTAPSSNALHADVAISSGSFTDWIMVQWQIEDAPVGNAFGLHAEAFYDATAGFPS